MAVTQRHGRSLSNDHIGNNTSVQEIYGGGQTARLTLLSYQQKLFDNRLDIEFGRLSTNPNFLSSPIYCNFQNNSTCGGPTSAFKMINLGFWPISTWGAHAKAWVTDKVFLHGGIYEVNPNTQRLTDNGIDWSTRGATGFTLPYEIGYTTTFANDILPRNYGIGGVVDRSDYSDPYLDVQNRPAVLSGFDRRVQFGRSLVYARFDQMVWRPDPTAPQGLTLFGVAIKGTEGRQINDYYLEGGALLLGTFPGRPYDTVGFVISNQKFSSLGLAGVRTARASLGLNPRDIATQQLMLELNYGVQITPAIRLTPNLQYIVNPDKHALPLPGQADAERVRLRHEAVHRPVHVGRHGEGDRIQLGVRRSKPRSGHAIARSAMPCRGCMLVGIAEGAVNGFATGRPARETITARIGGPSRSSIAPGIYAVGDAVGRLSRHLETARSGRRDPVVGTSFPDPRPNLRLCGPPPRGRTRYVFGDIADPSQRVASAEAAERESRSGSGVQSVAGGAPRRRRKGAAARSAACSIAR